MTALLLIAAALFAESTLAFTTQASAAVVCVLLALRAALHMVRPSAVLIIDRAGVRAGGRTIPWPAVRATQLLDNGLRVDVHDELEPGGDLVVTARGVRWSSAAALIERVAFDLPDADQSAS